LHLRWEQMQWQTGMEASPLVVVLADPWFP
jgi:hypothetical protein